MAEPITLVISGKARPSGSKNSVVPTYGNGEPVRRHRKDCPLGGGRATGCMCPVLVNTLEDNPHAAAWKEAVGWIARQQYHGEALDGPLSVEMIFYKPRPKSHFGTGRNAGLLKDSAPAFPTTRPDVLKLARAIEDGLSGGVIYSDDALIVSEGIAKRWCAAGEEERVEVVIRQITLHTVQDLVAAGALEPQRPSEEFAQLLLVAV